MTNAVTPYVVATEKTILFLNHTAKISGAERVLLVILRNLDRSRFTPCAGCPPGTLADVCAEMGIAVVALPEIRARFTSNPIQLLGYIASALGSVAGFRASLWALNPDILHANTVRAGLVAAIASAGFGIPTVWHLHDMLPQSRFGKLIRLAAYMLPNISAIAVSHAAEGSFRLAFGERFIRRFPITVIHNSVDTERYTPDLAARRRVREELGLTRDDIAVGIVGQLTRRKGQMQMLAGFAAQASTMPHVHLYIVGAAVFTADDRAYAEELCAFVATNKLADRVHLLGERRDIPALLCGMDIVALNSAAEPFGLALAEGLSTEVPAVAPGIDGFLEVVDHGVTGLLSQPGDVAGLLANLQLLADNPTMRDRMGRQGRIEMQRRFSEAAQVAAVNAFYVHLAGDLAGQEPA